MSLKSGSSFHVQLYAFEGLRTLFELQHAMSVRKGKHTVNGSNLMTTPFGLFAAAFSLTDTLPERSRAYQKVIRLVSEGPFLILSLRYVPLLLSAAMPTHF